MATAICGVFVHRSPAAAPPSEAIAAVAESSAADETASDASYSADELPQSSAAPHHSGNLMHASKLRTGSVRAD